MAERISPSARRARRRRRRKRRSARPNASVRAFFVAAAAFAPRWAPPLTRPPSPTSVVVPRGRDGDPVRRVRGAPEGERAPRGHQVLVLLLLVQAEPHHRRPAVPQRVRRAGERCQHLNGNSRSVARTEHSFNQCAPSPFIDSVLCVSNPSSVCMTSA